MSTRVIRLEVDENLYRELQEVADRLAMGTVEAALRTAAAQWIARQKGEPAEGAASERYFVNEALDELMSKKP